MSEWVRGMSPSAGGPFSRWFVSCTALLLWSCTGSINGGPESPSAMNGPGIQPSLTGNEQSPMLPGQTGTPMAPGALPPDNGVAPGPSAAPLRRLTTREYHNTVRDLLRASTSRRRAFRRPLRSTASRTTS